MKDQLIKQLIECRDEIESAMVQYDDYADIQFWCSSCSAMWTDDDAEINHDKDCKLNNLIIAIDKYIIENGA